MVEFLLNRFFKRNNTLALLIFSAGVFFMSFPVKGQVTVTQGLGGTDQCIGNNYVTLTDIKITEGTNVDFGAGTGLTIDLILPAGFEYDQTATGLAYERLFGNISNVVDSYVNANTYRITYDVDNTIPANDEMIISGLKVRPVAASSSSNGNLTFSEPAGNVTGLNGQNAGPVSSNEAPVITANPSDAQGCPGASVSFSVTATGTSLSYQWQEDDGTGFTDMNGETAATLNITDVTGKNTYQYQCIVSNVASCPQAVSTAATLTVYNPPSDATISGDATICEGDNTDLTFTVTGGASPYDVVYEDGSASYFVGAISSPHNETITPSTTATYTLVSVTDANGCDAANLNGSATVTVNPKPVITNNPSDAQGCAGTSASFSVTATGTSLSYQWQEDDGTGFADLSGETTSSLTIADITGKDTYQYRCVVTSGASCTATSLAATLTVYDLPAGTISGTATICQGDNTNLTFTMSGGSSPYDVVYTDGSSNFSLSGISSPYDDPVSPATTTTYNLVSVKDNNGCVATSLNGSPVVTVANRPEITSQPADEIICEATNAVFNVNAGATSSPTYQWQRSTNGGSSWINLSDVGRYSGTSTATLTVSNTPAGFNGNLFRCIVGGACTPSIASDPALLTVETNVSITTQPSDLAECEDGAVQFTVTATGTSLIYQWQENNGSGWSNLSDGGIYSGTGTDVLTLTGITSSMNSWDYRVTVVNGGSACVDSEISNSANLAVNEKPEIASQPLAATVCEGTSALFSVNAGATTSPGYQWQVSTDGGTNYANLSNDGTYSGVTTASLSVNAVAGLSGNLYRCEVSGTCAPPVYSSGAQLTVEEQAVIVTQPVDVTDCEEGVVTFSVVASGTNLSYIWQENASGSWVALSDGGIYSGTTTSTLTLNGINSGMNGYQYRVLVTNGGAACAGSVVSNAVTLNVNDKPVITSQPAIPATVCEDVNSISMSVTATGTAISYQWQESTDGGSNYSDITNGGVYSGATSQNLTLTNVPAGMDGYLYRCMVSGTCTPPAISNQVPIDINRIPDAAATNPVICSGSQTDIQITNPNSVPYTTFSWVVQAADPEVSGQGPGSGTQITQVLTNSSTDSKTVTYRITPEASGCVGNYIDVVQSVSAGNIANAGADRIECEGVAAITIDDASIDGSATFPPSVWTIQNGTGTLLNPDQIDPTYVPASGEVGTITLKLTAADAGSCPDAVDYVDIEIIRESYVFAGADKEVCYGSDVLLVDATSGGSTSSVTWIGGAGVFLPDRNTLNAIYQPDISEMGSTIQLILMSNDPPGPCTADSDTVDVTIDIAPIANAGSDVLSCEKSGPVTISDASVGGGATFPPSVWSIVNGTGTLTGENTITPTYTPATGEIGVVTLQLTASGGVCPDDVDYVDIDIKREAFVYAGADKTFCGNEDITLIDAATGGSTTSITWSGGSGTFIPNNTTLNAIYHPDPSEYGTTVQLIITSNDPPGPCGPASDTVELNIDNPPLVNAGTNKVVCEGENIELDDATSGGGTLSVTWSGGSGVFLPDANTLHATYVPDVSEIGTTVTLTLSSNDPAGPCLTATDQVLVTINKSPEVYAGADRDVCESENVLIGDATAGGSTTSVLWTGGSGTFLPNNTTLNVTYVPDPSETGTTVVLTVTTNDPAGPCPAVSDDVAITIYDMPEVNAGADKVLCEGENADLSDATSSGGTSSITWTGGAGVFLPDNTTLHATYVPDPTEIGNTVTLTLTSNDPAGPCNAVSDQVQVTFNKSPEVYAGADQEICEGETALFGDATIGGATSTVSWTGGAGTFLPNNTTLNATYVPDPSETGTTVILTITTNDPVGPCAAVSDNVSVTIYDAPEVNAGSDQILCEGENAVLSDATSGGGTNSVTWTGGVGTFLPDANTLNATYVPDASEVGTTVILTLSSDDPAGPCTTVNDQVLITINRAPVVNAGTDITICETSQANLNGSIGGSATSATWTTSGDGTFSFPGDLSATYTPGTNDISNRQVTLTLTTNDPSGPCDAVSDQVVIFIDEAPIAYAGLDTIECEGTSGVTIPDASVGGGATFPPSIWTIISGNGTLVNDNTITPTYVPAAGEIGKITLQLSASSGNVCPPALDNVDVEIIRDAFVNAGADKVVCGGEDVLLTDATMGGSTTSVTWSGGLGTFIPDVHSLHAVYRPDPSEVGTTFDLYLTSNDPPGTCTAVTDTVQITLDEAPVAYAGSDVVTCEGAGSVTITDANVSGGATFPPSYWELVNGSGTLLDSNTVAPTYVPAAGEIGTVTLQLTASGGVCPDDVDYVDININRVALVYAGADKVVCEGDNITMLDAAMGGSTTSVTWSGGTGTFVPNNTTLNVIYVPDPSETGTTVQLYLTSDDPAGPCGPAMDTVDVTINIGPKVNAGTDKVICEGENVELSDASISGDVDTVTWSGGAGVFLPDVHTLNATYVPDVSEIGATVVLTLTSNDPAGPCLAVSDQVSVTINVAPVVYAGADKDACEGESLLISDATIGGTTTSVTWTGGSGVFLPNNSTLNVTYVPDASEVGTTVYLVLTSNDPAGPCLPASDTVALSIYNAAEVYAGADKVYCEGENGDLFDASIGGSATSVTWTGGSGVFLPDNHAINPEYVPDPSEIGTTVTLTLNTNDPAGPCPFVTSSVQLTFNRAPVVDAGTDRIICETSTVNLNGTIGGSAVSATWTTTGDGDFSFAGDLNAVYTPGPTDKSNGLVTLILTTNDPDGPCAAVSDSLDVQIRPRAISIPGSYSNICIGDTVFLAGNIGGAATSATWNGGVGVFGDPNSLNTYYIPNDPNEVGEIVTLSLVTDDPDGPCPADVQTTSFEVYEKPDVIFFGLQTQYAIDDDPVTLTGNPAGGTFSGDGMAGDVFSPLLAGVGIHEIRYTYTNANGCTNYWAQLTRVLDLPDVTIPTPGPWCVNVVQTDADSLPRNNLPGTHDEWSGNNVFSKVVNGKTQYYFNYAVAGVGKHTISYTFTDQNDVSVTVDKEVVVNPAPVADFEQIDFCMADPIRLRDLSTVDDSILPDNSIEEWSWTSKKGVLSESDAINPEVSYSVYGIDTIRLIVTTNWGCVDTLQNNHVIVGGVPDAAFIWMDVASGSPTTFEVTTRMPEDDPTDSTGFSTIFWDFGDGTTDNNNLLKIQHQYNDRNTYDVQLILVTDYGCSDSVVNKVTILKTITQFPSLLDFNDDQEGFTGGRNSSWEWAVPAGKVIKPQNLDPTDKTWITNADSTYNNDEASYVELPYYVLDNLTKPMVRVTYWTDAESQRDGAVLQIRVTAGSGGNNEWIALNDLSDPNPDNRLGVWWYNDKGLIGNPGVVDPGDLNDGAWGWTRKDTTWRVASYPLDDYIGKTVQFRIAFGSDGANAPEDTLDGFAFDDFWIGERSRKVLVEHFTNMNLNLSYISDFYDFLDDNQKDLNYMQYHAQYPQPDELYNDNPNLANTRGTVYDIQQVPRSFVSGYYTFKNTDQLKNYDIINNAMLDPVFEVTLDTIPTGSPNTAKIQVSVKAMEDVNDLVILHTAIIENEVTRGNDQFKNIVRDMLPHPGGNVIQHTWTEGQTETFVYDWDINNVVVDDGSKLSVVAFVQGAANQGEKPNWVYQSSYLKLPSKQKTTITGIEDIESAFNKIVLFPNPAKRIFHLGFSSELSKDYHWRILDLRGVELASGTFAAGYNEYEIDISHLPNGVFHVMVTDDGNIYFTKKLMILR